MREEALLARERGVTFDIGHGAGSFGFHACRGLLAAGFRPDVISSDVHVLNVDGPAFDLLTTMSKFLVLGVDVNALVAAVTAAPAKAIRRPSLGTLAVGTEGDATIVDIEHGAFEFHDTQGERLAADRRFRLKGMVVAGKRYAGERGLNKMRPPASAGALAGGRWNRAGFKCATRSRVPTGCTNNADSRPVASARGRCPGEAIEALVQLRFSR